VRRSAHTAPPPLSRSPAVRGRDAKSAVQTVPMTLLSKRTLLGSEAPALDAMFAEVSTAVRWNSETLQPTNTRWAAVDALVLQHGVAVALTAYSSLTPLLYARRCYDGPRCLGRLYGPRGLRGPRTTHLYEVRADGSLTNALALRCGYRMQELLRGGGLVDPPPSDDLFSENPRPNSTALFERAMP
jgi:hypothetical protein